MSGGDGDDSLFGDEGVDRIRGGTGADTIDASGGGAELVRCGAGDDDVTRHDPNDRLADDCERAELRSALFISAPDVVLQPLTLRGRTLRGLGIACPMDAAAGGCRGTIATRTAGGKTIGSGRVKARPGQRVAVPVRLSGKLPGSLASPGLHLLTVTVKLEVTEPDSDGGKPHRTPVKDSVRTFALT